LPQPQSKPRKFIDGSERPEIVIPSKFDHNRSEDDGCSPSIGSFRSGMKTEERCTPPRSFRTPGNNDQSQRKLGYSNKHTTKLAKVEKPEESGIEKGQKALKWDGKNERLDNGRPRFKI
jgi:hypothetical protein